MRVRILDDFEVRYMDAQNLRVWQYKELERGERKGQMDWVPLESYHRDIGDAVAWLRKNMPRRKYRAVEADLEGTLGILREIERDMAGHAKRFEKAARAALASARGES